MNASFLDELLKVGAARCLLKSADDINTVDIPHGMIGSAASPESDRVVPDEAATRMQGSHASPVVEVGRLGSTTPSRNPIDRERYNRLYRDRR